MNSSSEKELGLLHCVPIGENSEQDRLEMIKKSALADKVVLGSKLDLKNKDNKVNCEAREGGLGHKQFVVIKKYKPDIICLGYDQKFFVDRLEDSIENIKIVRMKSYKPEIYKSSKLKNNK